MRVTVRLFARLRDIAGADELALEVPDGATVADVWERLAAELPGAGRYAPFGVGGGERRLREDAFQGRGDGDEVAFLPPVSGG